MHLSWPVFAQGSNAVICFYVRPPEVTKNVFEKVTPYIGMILETRTAHLGLKNWAIDLKFWTLVDD